jgi:hypothetical protein
MSPKQSRPWHRRVVLLSTLVASACSGENPDSFSSAVHAFDRAADACMASEGQQWGGRGDEEDTFNACAYCENLAALPPCEAEPVCLPDSEDCRQAVAQCDRLQTDWADDCQMVIVRWE